MHAPLLLSVMLVLAACTTPAQPTPTPVSPVVQTVLVPQTVVVTAVPLATRAIQPSTPTVIPSLMANPTVTSAAMLGRPTPSGYS